MLSASLAWMVKHFDRLLVDDLNRPVVLCPERGVQQAIARRQIEERMAFLQKALAN
jgi:hypothetical protein